MNELNNSDNISSINLTDSALNKIYDLMIEENNLDLKLRAFVQGGGCSGFQYGFTFDEIANDDDFVMNKSLDDKKICIIIDRDKKSFTTFQYEEVLNIAEKNDYTLGISNPNFEFFLLLHMNDLSVLSTEELINNPKVTSKKRLMESLLKDECKKNDTTFNKNNYDCEWFLDNFENGYTNSLNYAHEVEELKESPGSSLFNILQEWIKP